jgi:outer membrane lipoprotein-sorting protein
MTVFPVLSGVQAQDAPEVEDIVRKVDLLYRSKSSEGNVEMIIITENWSRTLRMEIWSEGLDRTFIHVTYPKKDAGVATLRIENEMWNYFPKINKVMKVPPSMMMSSWMGSDFTNDDLVKESSMLRDYYYSRIDPEDSEPGYYYIELVPKEDIPTVWGKIQITVRKEDYIPVRQVYYDEKGRKMRIMDFKEIKTFGDRRIPAVIELVPLNKKGKKTIVRYKELRFDGQLDKGIFTLRNLQKRR